MMTEHKHQRLGASVGGSNEQKSYPNDGYSSPKTVNPFKGVYVYNPHRQHGSDSVSDSDGSHESSHNNDHDISDGSLLSSEYGSGQSNNEIDDDDAPVIEAESTWNHSHRLEASESRAEVEIETTPDTVMDHDKKSRNFWTVFVLVLTLAAALFTGIGVWWQNLQAQQSNHINETLTISATPTSAPNMPWNSLGDYHETLLQIVQANANDYNQVLDAWTIRGTPQFEALRFVAYQDGGVIGGGDMGYYYEDDTPLLLQRLALLVLYYQTGGGFSWTGLSPLSASNVSSNFLFDDDMSEHAVTERWATPGVDECFWDGVICDTESYRVTHLVLNDRGLTGTIPIETWTWLPHLNTIDFSNNRLTGSLPSDFLWPFSNSFSFSKQMYLTHLQHLDLSFNHLEGRLPMDLAGGLPSLQILNLGNNRLTGNLPRNYRRDTLEQLHLSSNKLTGTLPLDDWFETNSGTSNSLLLLDLGNNLLSGSIPVSIQKNPLLEFLSLQNNPLLSGSLPPANIIQSLERLKTIQISECALSGSLTESLAGFFGLPNLERLSIAGNQLTGRLPTLEQVQTTHSSATLFPSTLQFLNLGNNAITGTIPPDLFGEHLIHLGHLQLFGNDLQGSIPHLRFHPTILSVFWIQDNPRLEGTMPCSSAMASSTSSNLEATTMQEDMSVTSIVVNPSDGGVGNDYRADCGDAVSIECPCCRRCF